jgi:hypothetical protein
MSLDAAGQRLNSYDRMLKHTFRSSTYTLVLAAPTRVIDYKIQE